MRYLVAIILSAMLSGHVNAQGNGEQWLLEIDTSELDDRNDIWLSITSINLELNQIDQPEPAYLWLRCFKNKTNVIIGFNRYISENQEVDFKFDDGPVQSQQMLASRGGDLLAVQDGRESIEFINLMLDRKKFIVAFKTFGGLVEFSFDVSGLRERISPLSDACGW